MALKDKLMTLEDFKAVRDVDVASNSAQFTELRADLDDVNESLDAINASEIIELSSGYIDTHGLTVDINTVVESTTYSHGIKACVEGDMFNISGSGGAAPRLWCFIDSSGNVLSNSLQNVNESGLLLTAPENAAYCIINTKTPNVASYKGAPINVRVGAIESNLESVSSDLSNTASDLSTLTTKVDGGAGRFYEAGLTWDWWYTSSVTDEYGTTYIGFIDQNAKCGVMMRKSDGQTLYKYFDTARNADDHNPFGVTIDKDGYVFLFGTLGHSYKNYMVIYKADVPNTINCTWTKLVSKIAQPTGATYKTCYSQAFTYYDSTEDKEYITNFFRCLTSGVGACYAAVQSIDGGTTWTLHGVIIVHDPYIKFFDKGNGILGMACTYNTASTNRNVYLGEIDVKTGNIYANGTLVGTWSTIANGLDSGTPTQEVYDSVTVTAENDFVTYHTANDRFRLLDARYNPTSNATEILWALMDTGGMDYTYYLYDGTTEKYLGKSGVPFYLYSGYLPGMSFIDDDLIGIARNVSGVQDGKHTFEVYSISDDEVKKRVSYNNMCIRPLDCGNGLIALSIGVYNDTSDISTTGIFTAWRLSPVFINTI